MPPSHALCSTARCLSLWGGGPEASRDHELWQVWQFARPQSQLYSQISARQRKIEITFASIPRCNIELIKRI
jgi:hypothetical protein